MFGQEDLVTPGNEAEAEPAESTAVWEAGWRQPGLAQKPAGAEPSTEEPAPRVPEADATDWQAQAAAATQAAQKLQSDLNSMKSNYDRQRFQIEQKFQQDREAMEARMGELEMRDMDEATRGQYLQKRELERMERTASTLDQREWTLQQRESKLAWGDFFVNRIGVEPQTLRMDGEFEEFHSAGWQAVEGLVGQLRAQNAQLMQVLQANKINLPDTTQAARGRPIVGKAPPRVETRIPGSAPSPRRLADIPIAERERLFQAFERGDIRPEDMPV